MDNENNLEKIFKSMTITYVEMTFCKDLKVAMEKQLVKDGIIAEVSIKVKDVDMDKMKASANQYAMENGKLAFDNATICVKTDEGDKE